MKTRREKDNVLLSEREQNGKIHLAKLGVLTAICNEPKFNRVTSAAAAIWQVLIALVIPPPISFSIL